MHYAPHTLYKKQSSSIQMDEFGKPIVCSKESWVKVGECRCDDDTTQELVSENGQSYRSRYHVVYDRTNMIAEGDEIRCVDKCGATRGEGKVGMVKSTNYFSYSELWT